MAWVVCLTAGAANSMVAKVVAVIDGNTIEVVNASNEKFKVMLAGIDCPELGQDFGDKAKACLEKLLLRKEVTITLQGKDRTGNHLGVIMLGDDDPRIKLLKEGLAWTSEKNPSPELEPYRTWAEQKGRGLWKLDNPTPPWTFRRQQSMAGPKSS